MKIAKELVVKPNEKFSLHSLDPGETLGRTKEESQATLAENLERLRDLQGLLYADHRYALLIVLQALDAGGKDGTISHVMSGVNPQGCEVTSFKVPSVEEADHDFLWRIHKAVPRRGMIGIFNRSHYEDVLVTRVHHLVKKDVWKSRYDQINSFEKMLSENHVRIVKFFLNISKEKQRERFEDRVSDPKKYWKISPSDFTERQHWDDYLSAYNDALRKCSTDDAPWYVIPSDKKWFRNLAVSEIIIETLESMKLKYPEPLVPVSEIPAEFRTGTEHGGNK
jgi:PPK2 family polyphosphate:nucleotide phosphotransferase